MENSSFKIYFGVFEWKLEMKILVYREV